MRVFLGCCLALCLAHGTGAQAGEPATTTELFRIAGAVEKPGDWSAERLSHEFRDDVEKIHFTLKGQEGVARAVKLEKLIRAAAPKLDEAQKHHLLAFNVVARARDGYAVCFSLAEFLPEYGGGQIYVALDVNCKPFADDEQPVRLLVIKDKRPSRWIYGLRELIVVDGLAAIDK